MNFAITATCHNSYTYIIFMIALQLQRLFYPNRQENAVDAMNTALQNAGSEWRYELKGALPTLMKQ